MILCAGRMERERERERERKKRGGEREMLWYKRRCESLSGSAGCRAGISHSALNLTARAHSIRPRPAVRQQPCYLSLPPFLFLSLSFSVSFSHSLPLSLSVSHSLYLPPSLSLSLLHTHNVLCLSLSITLSRSVCVYLCKKQSLTASSSLDLNGIHRGASALLPYGGV